MSHKRSRKNAKLNEDDDDDVQDSGVHFGCLSRLETKVYVTTTHTPNADDVLPALNTEDTDQIFNEEKTHPISPIEGILNILQKGEFNDFILLQKITKSYTIFRN